MVQTTWLSLSPSLSLLGPSPLVARHHVASGHALCALLTYKTLQSSLAFATLIDSLLSVKMSAVATNPDLAVVSPSSAAERVWEEPHLRRAILKEYINDLKLQEKKCPVGLHLLDRATEDDLLDLIYEKVSLMPLVWQLEGTTKARPFFPPAR